jgi:UV DNA damage endonuclease
MIRLGLCCQFIDAPIHFRRATATALQRLGRAEQRRKLAELCRHNAEALRQALEHCHGLGIGAFRVNSQILPLRTHPDVGYQVADLPDGEELQRAFLLCGQLALAYAVRLSFHPDQFVVLSSPDEGVRRRSLEELVYQTEVAVWIGADVINLHAGGGYGDKAAALARLRTELERAPAELRSRLTLENDDRVYTPADLLPLCRDTGTPLVYDVHHHRCLPDALRVEEATAAALRTWAEREPLFHVSSPREGWAGRHPQYHADYIEDGDVPACWRDLTLTLDVEAKAKERAVLRLRQDLDRFERST